MRIILVWVIDARRGIPEVLLIVVGHSRFSGCVSPVPQTPIALREIDGARDPVENQNLRRAPCPSR